MKNPKVFTDFHHAGLLNSLILLFENRLGGEVYRPIGRDWYDKGYWKIYEHPATVAQFLDIGGATPDGTQPLNNLHESNHIADIGKMPRVYKCQDIDSGLYNKAITFQGFLETDIDIVIASIPQHIAPFTKLIREHKPTAKLIYQIGNAWTIEAGLANNIMASAIINDLPSGTNAVMYHQEFDTKNIFYPVFGLGDKKIASFVNCFSIDGMFSDDFNMFQKVEWLMDDWDFKCFGGQCRDGAKHGAKQVAQEMQNSRFIWHVKRGGDGYGHVLFNSAAVAKPAIVKMEYYKNKLGGALMIDQKTCIAIDGLNPEEIAYKINYYNEPSRYLEMQENVYRNFCEVVDFDREEQQIREFLLHLKPIDIY